MMNPMALMQMLRGGGNPQAMLMNIMKQNAGNNPVLNNTMQMMEKNDYKGIEQLARNLGKEKGVQVDDLFNQIRGQFGMK